MALFSNKTSILLCCEDRLVFYQTARQQLALKEDIPLSSPDDLPVALQTVRQLFVQKADEALLVGLPLRYFNFVQFSLPRAAEENLAEAVRYELLRHVSYSLDLAWHDFTSELQGDMLQIRVMLALRQPLQSHLAAIAAAGLTVTAVAPALLLVSWLAGGDGLFMQLDGESLALLQARQGRVLFAAARNCSAVDPRQLLAPLQQGDLTDTRLHLWGDSAVARQIAADLQLPAIVVDPSLQAPVPSLKSLAHRIDLVSPEVLQQRRLRLRLLLVATLLCALSLAAYPFASMMGRQAALTQIDAEVGQMRQKAEALDALRQDNQTLIERHERLAAFVQAQPQPLDLLKEVTDVLTPETWLNAFEFRERRLTLRGTSTSATAVLESLATSPLLQQVKFDSPVVKQGDKETFTIVATLK